MTVTEETRKKANKTFFSKLAWNAVLIIIGAVLISVLLGQIQRSTVLAKHRNAAETVLLKTEMTISEGQQETEELTRFFHDGNQDILDEMRDLLDSGMYEIFEENPVYAADTLNEIKERADIEDLLLVDSSGKILYSADWDQIGKDPAALGILDSGNLKTLINTDTRTTGDPVPVEQSIPGTDYFKYFYSAVARRSTDPVTILMSADSGILDVQISRIKDLQSVLETTDAGSTGTLFAVDLSSGTFLYFNNGETDLTGENVLSAGLHAEALKNGYSGTQTISGRSCYVVTRAVSDDILLCSAAETDKIYYNDKYVLIWSNTGFILIMILCLTYAVIIRNDLVRRAVETTKKKIGTFRGRPVYFNESIFGRVFPLMMIGVLTVFSISFYTQSLLEVSAAMQESREKINEISTRYDTGTLQRKVFTDYYTKNFTAKAQLMAQWFEQQPYFLNLPTDHFHVYYDKDNNRKYVLDDEGNRLRSIASSEMLQSVAQGDDVREIALFEENGHVIASSTDGWYRTISRDPEDPSGDFRQVLDGEKDIFVQEMLKDENGSTYQYIGVAMNYYTTVSDAGETTYVSERDYTISQNDPGESSYGEIHKHRGMLQISLDTSLSEKLIKASSDETILGSAGGDSLVMLFSNDEDPVCLYAPGSTYISRTASALGISSNAFRGEEYFGYTKLGGHTWFLYVRPQEKTYIGMASPYDQLYSARFRIALLTVLTSLFLTLILSLTVTLTRDEDELLYASMSPEQAQKAREASIFNITLPSGRLAATVMAAARWDNRHIPWDEKTPEKKLLTLIRIAGELLILYVIISVLGVDRFFEEDSVMQYILHGNWDKGVNIFAVTQCMIVIMLVGTAASLFRIPMNMLSSLFGARGETIAHLLLSVVRYGSVIGSLFYSLYLLGVDAPNLLASAGILSLVIGLGAQSLIKDILAGFFIIFEGEFRVGDIVTVAGYRGTVMDIGLRTTKIMGMDRNIKIFNNSEVSGVLNMTKESSVSIAKIGIEYGQDLSYVEEVLERELPLLKDKDERILEGPTYLGVSELSDSAVILMFIARCKELNVGGVSRFMNKELLRIFRENNISVPFPHVTISNWDNGDTPKDSQ
ncbi:MAG: mechanosensitive ion channel family protein [Solobacterium sp.]|nr:mechanosensitive ion channel family protein [Solobacterium sp.]